MTLFDHMYPPVSQFRSDLRPPPGTPIDTYGHPLPPQPPVDTGAPPPAVPQPPALGRAPHLGPSPLPGWPPSLNGGIAYPQPHPIVRRMPQSPPIDFRQLLTRLLLGG